MKKYIEPLKTGVSVVVSFGVGTIIGNLVKSTTPVDIGKVMKGCIAFSSWVLSGIGADMASKYTEDKIDEIVETMDDVVYGKDQEENTEEKKET